MKNVTVVAVFEARPGQENELRKVLAGLVQPTRKEPGCINYDLHVFADNPAKLLFHENWQSRELLDTHLQSAHLKAALARVHELCAAPPAVNFLEKIA
jgi:quinol monooxygenase YgiN